jgi:transketolase
MKAALFRELYEIMHNNEEVFLLGKISSSPELSRIAQDFKTRFIDISDCEQSALSIALSLANKGTLVIFCIPLPSFIIRWYEDLLLTIGQATLPIILIGITPNKPAEQRVLASYRPEMVLAYTIPSLTIIAPATRREVGTLLAQACKLRRPFYIHFERNNDSEIATSKTLPTLFEPIEYSHGTQAICIGIGSALDKAHQGKVLLESYGYSTSLVSMHTVKPLNHAFLHKIMHSYSAIFTFEDHDAPLGIGNLIGSFIAEHKTRTILFKPFGPSLSTAMPGKSPAAYPSAKAFDMRSAGLEMLDLLASYNVIPDHESWIKNKS